MQAISRTLGLLWDALFLRRGAYEFLREDDNPFVEGLYILAVLGIALALLGVVGSSLEWASSPNIAEIESVVLRNLKQMPWWEMIERQGGTQAVDQFQNLWDTQWFMVKQMSPTPVASLAGLVTRPLGLIVGWLVFGVLAHLLARLLGGTGTLNQTLGTTALAAAPQMLTAVTVLPFVVVAGVSTWVLLCRYMAIRVAHQLSWQRAVGATILPPVIVGAVFTLLGILAGIFLSAIIAGVQ